MADYDDDYAIEDQTSDLDTPTITVAMGATTISLKEEGIDDLYDDTQQGDIGVSTSFGAATVALTLDTRSDETDTAAGVTTDDAQMSYSFGYSMDGITVSLTGTDADDAADAAMKVGVSYTMGDITVGLVSDNKGAGETVNDLTLTYAAGPAKITLSADDNDDWEASVAYTAGAASVYFGTDEESAWEANVSYDLGGGVSMNAAINEAEYMAAGINFTF